MKATDLRIGNYHNYLVKDPIDVRKQWNEVCQIDAYDLLSLSKDPDVRYQPIPLTEEWLLKFGFVKEVEYKKKINFSRFHLFQINASNSYNDNENEFKVNFYQSKQCVELCRIKHVHQLQNLYFALTGEELTL